MTDPEFADATYIEPITPESVTKIIEKERPDALLATLGGQTALNTAMALHDSGVLEQYGVELIGADVDAIRRGEDRQDFKEVVESIGAESARSAVCHTHGRAARRGRGPRLPGRRAARRSPWAAPAAASPTTRPTCAASAAAGCTPAPPPRSCSRSRSSGWKEYELELMRDRNDNVVVICSIENLDPMGVHTGDSITVAPAMTLTDREYQRLRDIAIAVIRAVGVDTGGCNIQFAVNPGDGRIIVIEMNPRVSRVQRAGVQGHRLPDRQDRRQARHRLHPRRDPQRHHPRDAGAASSRRSTTSSSRSRGSPSRSSPAPTRR